MEDGAARIAGAGAGEGVEVGLAGNSVFAAATGAGRIDEEGRIIGAAGRAGALTAVRIGGGRTTAGFDILAVGPPKLGCMAALGAFCG